MTNQETVRRETTIILIVAILASVAIFNFETTTDSLNQITGAVVSRVNITPLQEVPCQFTAEPGWNLVSFYCITLTAPRGLVIDNITELTSIFEYQEGNSIDPWKSYNPGLDSVYVQDLVHLSRAEGYWIDMRASENIYVEGGLRLPTDISLQPGWNLVGYPTNETKGTNYSLRSIYGNYTEIRGFNSTNKVFLSFIPPDTGGLRNTTPNQGYWINATVNEVWTVD